MSYWFRTFIEPLRNKQNTFVGWMLPRSCPLAVLAGWALEAGCTTLQSFFGHGWAVGLAATFLSFSFPPVRWGCQAFLPAVLLPWFTVMCHTVKGPPSWIVLGGGMTVTKPTGMTGRQNAYCGPLSRWGKLGSYLLGQWGGEESGARITQGCRNPSGCRTNPQGGSQQPPLLLFFKYVLKL